MFRVLRTTLWVIAIPLAVGMVNAAVVYQVLVLLIRDAATARVFTISTFVLTFGTAVCYGLIHTGSARGFHEKAQIVRVMTGFGVFSLAACGAAKLPVLVYAPVVAAHVAFAFFIGRHMRSHAAKSLPNCEEH